MRRKEREINDQNLVEEILQKQTICRVAMHDDDFPYIVPMNYGYRAGALYFHCAKEGRKIDLLHKNPKVGFEIEAFEALITGAVSCTWTTKYRSLIGTGRIEFVEDFAAKKEGLQVIMEQHGRKENDFVDRLVDRVCILKLLICDVVGKQGGDWD